MKNKIIILALLFTLASCISEYNPTLSSIETEILTIEGDIIGNTLCTFYLGKNVSLNSEPGAEDYTVEGSVMLIDSKGNESAAATRIGKGEYQLWIGELDADTQYGLKILYDGHTYQSELAYPVYTPPIDSLSFTQAVAYDPVEFTVSTHDPSSDIGYYRWQYEEDWERTAMYRTSVGFDLATETYYELVVRDKYYCWHKTRNNEQTVISTSQLKENRVINQPIAIIDPMFRFRTLYCISVTQQAMSRRGFEYHENKKAVNNDVGGLFSPQPSMVEGNIECISNSERKVIGYVEVSRNFEHKRLYIYPGQISSSNIQQCELMGLEEVMNMLEKNGLTMTDFYKMGYRPVGDIYALDMLEWATDRCVECTLNGGTKDRPDWWPDNGHY